MKLTDRINTMDETYTQELIETIYSECYGHLDDKWFRDDKLTEIYDWLVNGDAFDCTVQDLVNEWREYDADDIEANA
jgi:hypothetical protein